MRDVITKPRRRTRQIRVGDVVIGGDAPVVLVLFGGCGNPAFDLDALAAMPEWRFLLPADSSDPLPSNAARVDLSGKLRAVDLLPHIDLLLCKPGYGLLSECWVTSTPIAWVERPDFPEFPVLRRWLDELFPAAGMSRDDFHAGRWADTLAAALSCERRYPEIREDGALVAARAIQSLLAGGC